MTTKLIKERTEAHVIASKLIAVATRGMLRNGTPPSLEIVDCRGEGARVDLIEIAGEEELRALIAAAEDALQEGVR